MPLTLVTGPANAAKARVVLDAYRAAIKRDEAPILVVPTFADVERYRSELASGGVVFGAQIVRFGWLVDEIARRGGVRGRPLAPLARERVAAAATAVTPLSALAGSARTAGFARALLRLVDELEEQRVTPQRFTQALRAWAASDDGRRAYADEVAGLYAAYRRKLERLGRRDEPLHAAAALDAVREDPAAWGSTPVFVYGFDDLTALQRDAVETLAATGAQVMLSLAYEPGRMAFAGRATTFAELRPDEHRALTPRAEHYAPAARAALHHLERELFELPADGRLFEPDPIDAGEAVVLLQGGGERAELELVAAEIARLVADEGYAPEEIAVVLRDSAPVAALLTEVFGAFGVPVAIERRIAFGHTALGRGLVSLLRCALLEDARAADLLAWLRTPGLLRRPELVDALEVAARQAGVRTARAARDLWEAEHWRLAAIDRVRAASRTGAMALLECAGEELAALFTAPRRRGAEVLTGPAAQDADVLVAGRRALDELESIVGADPALAPTAAQLVALLDDLEVRGGTRPAPGRVTVTEPLALRARRVRALFACRLQEGVFPAVPGAEPFFGDAERERIAAASGLRLRRRDDLGAERYLFYATVSRPEERLYLSWHEASDDGDQAVPSFFLSDVCDLFGPSLFERRRMRTLGEVGWDVAPTPGERQRAAVAAGPRHREAPIAALGDARLVGELRDRRTWSASAVELWAGCPVRWFVERRLTPEGLTPDPELMRRGALAHRVLEATLSGLREQTGSARLDEERLPLARSLAIAALERLLHGADARVEMSPDPSRQRALARRLRADLERYLAHAARDGSELEPSSLEVVFGASEEGLPALELADGVRIGGRIDRIDRGPGGSALVYDYKGRNAPDAASWRRERKYQVAMYVLAARDVLGLDPIGGLYQPLGAKDQRARGLVRAGADPGLDTVATDRRDGEDFDATLAGVAEDVVGAVGELRAGRLVPRPQTCGWNGTGCVYPTICRCSAA